MSSGRKGLYMTLGAERKAAYILLAIALAEGAWVIVNAVGNFSAFISYLGFSSGRLDAPLGWVLAAVVTLLFVALACRLPSVRQTIFRPTWLKLIALVLAVAAGVLEEVVFRKILMDWLASDGYGQTLQVMASGLAFGAVHGVWGLFGRSLRAAAGATVATGILGTGLAVVYIAAGRNVAPCIVAHFVINALIEPGLVLAATRGEMAAARRTAA